MDVWKHGDEHIHAIADSLGLFRMQRVQHILCSLQALFAESLKKNILQTSQMDHFTMRLLLYMIFQRAALSEHRRVS